MRVYISSHALLCSASRNLVICSNPGGCKSQPAPVEAPQDGDDYASRRSTIVTDRLPAISGLAAIVPAATRDDHLASKDVT